MVGNRDIVSTRLEPLQAGGAEAPWVGGELSAKPDVVRGKRILVVEDQEPVRKSLRMLLELDEHRVTEAGDGVEALNLFSSGEFDLVITDFEMPMMKGNELTLRLKRLAPALPVLMVTASVSELAHGVENPVDAFLDKPFTWRDLRSALAKLLSGRAEPAQPSVVPPMENPSVSLATRATDCCPPAGMAV
jgi:CheY-like chemotaxis protein